ncbi:MAG: hypothetical protein IKP91_05065 [Bacteroidaceae bacterium]|nr:hypothetical protein [Bacteroidaceae bacterium]
MKNKMFFHPASMITALEGTPRRGREHTAQGNALGTNGMSNFRPERAKALHDNAFALSGRRNVLPTEPRALPWAGSFLPLQGACYCLSYLFFIFHSSFFIKNFPFPRHSSKKVFRN